MSSSVVTPNSHDRKERRLWTSDDEGYMQLSIPEFEYAPLNFEVEEHRFFLLHPSKAGLDDNEEHVRCELLTVPLAHAPPFIAVKNARGFRLALEAIEIDGKALSVPAALEKFLRHFRRVLDGPTLLWIRHISLEQSNTEERNKLWTREVSDRMYAKAREVVDMYEFNATLFDEGKMGRVVQDKYFDGWTKDWNCEVEVVMPTIFPIRLGKRCKDPNVEPLADDYDYVPLDVVVDEIRIAVLMPSADPKQPIAILMAHSPLHSDVTYAALSYRWGADEAFEEIILSGLKHKIRKSLADTLRSIRLADKQRPVWIDAISINQDDVMERNRQVARMGDIYDFAKAVICYAGPRSDDSDLALDLIKYLQNPVIKMYKGEWQFGKEHYDEETGWSFDENPIKPERLWAMCAALYKFLTRPYFRRLWVLQEWAFASNPYIVVGNNQHIGFRDLDMAAYQFLDMVARDLTLPCCMAEADPTLEDIDVDQLAFPRKLSYFRHLTSGGEWWSRHFANIKKTAPGFLESLIHSRSFECSDPRDRIFALYNIAQDKAGLNFQMDYTMSVQDVYMTFAKAWIAQHGKLDIVGAVEVTSETLSFYGSAPSWCPDWNTDSIASSLVRRERVPTRMLFILDDQDGELYSADGDMYQDTFDEHLFFFEGNILHCTGVILDELKHTFDDPGEIPDGYIITKACDPFSYYRYQVWSKQILGYYSQHDSGTYEDPEQAVTAMFHGDSSSAWPRREDNPDNASESDTDEKHVCVPSSSRHVLPYSGSYSRTTSWDVVKTVLKGRVPFMSETGYMGLCPSYLSHEPWKLGLIAGCSVPLLLAERGDGSYQIRGTAFVQGWMDGEALSEMMGADSPKEFWNALRGEKMRIY